MFKKFAVVIGLVLLQIVTTFLTLEQITLASTVVVENHTMSATLTSTNFTVTNSSPTVLSQTTTLTATVISDEPISYTWQLGDGAVGSGAVVTHVYPAVGNYTATVTATIATTVATTTITATDQITTLTATTLITIFNEISESSQVFLPVVIGESSQPQPPQSPTVKLGVDFGIRLITSTSTAVAFPDDIPVAKEMGPSWIRMYFPWYRIEESPGQYNWQSFDEEFEFLHQTGFKILPIVYGAPAWAAEEDCGPISDTVAFENFLGEAISRYASYVDAWEFTNEPDGKNLKDGWKPVIGCWGDHPQEYADQLKIFHRNVKKLDPTALVVAGGIAYDNWTVFERSFFTKTLQAGAGEFFDVANLHYYPINPVEFPTMAHKVNEIKGIMSRNGVEGKLIWVTETGMWVNMNGSVEHQKDFIVRELTRGYGAGLDNIFWFDVRAYPITSTTHVERWFIGVDHKPINGYWTYQNYAGKVQGTISNGPADNFADDIEAYHFSDTGRSLYILWSNNATQTVTMPSSIQAILTNRDGDSSTTLPVQDGNISFEVGVKPVFLEFISKITDNLESKIFSGHTEDCSAENQDVQFVGTEVIKLTTCLPRDASNFHLFANKPLSQKEVYTDSTSKIFETSISPTDTRNIQGSTFHSYITVDNDAVSFYGLDSDSSWTVGGFTSTTSTLENYIYINKNGEDSTDFRDGNSRLRWQVGDVLSDSDYLIIHWNLQILDITFLNDDQYSYQHGINKNLEFYIKAGDNSWQGPVVNLKRNADFAFFDTKNGKEHTIIKDNDKYSIISMNHVDNLKTYYDYTFDLVKGDDGLLAIKNFSAENKTLGPDFNIHDSADFCQLAAPHLIQENSKYVFYYTTFGNHGSSGCGIQRIYRTESYTLQGSLSMTMATLLLEQGRDPYVKDGVLYYSDATEPKLIIQDLETGVKHSLSISSNVDILWPESPSLLEHNGIQYLFFHNAYAGTTYMVKHNETWHHYQGYLSVPRRYEWESKDNATGLTKRRFASDHWGAEFWHDNLGTSKQFVLSSFLSTKCDNVAIWDCEPRPIALSYVNFDLYGHPYIASKPLDKPMGLSSSGLETVVDMSVVTVIDMEIPAP